MSTNNVSVEWITKESESQDLATTAREGGATVLESKSWTPGPDALDDYGDAMFEPLTAVAIIVGVGWLVSHLAATLDDVRRPGGELVDIRGESVVVRPLPRTKPPGKLVILTHEGTQVFEPDRRDDGLALLGKLLGTSGG